MFIPTHFRHWKNHWRSIFLPLVIQLKEFRLHSLYTDTACIRFKCIIFLSDSRGTCIPLWFGKAQSDWKSDRIWMRSGYQSERSDGMAYFEGYRTSGNESVKHKPLRSMFLVKQLPAAWKSTRMVCIPDTMTSVRSHDRQH